MSPVRAAVTALVVVLGVLAVISGESDDSPGLQGIGVLLVLGAVLSAVRHRRTRPVA